MAAPSATVDVNQGEVMNKREQQRKIKQEKQQAAQKKAQSKALASKVALFGITPVLALFVLYTLLNQGPTFSPVEIADSDHIRGEREHPRQHRGLCRFSMPRLRGRE